MTSKENDKIRSLMVRAIDEKGADHVAGGFYFKADGTPQCLFGHVLHYMGVDCDRVIEGASVTPMLKLFGRPKELNVYALVETQAVADGLGTWGEALEAYDKRMGYK